MQITGRKQNINYNNGDQPFNKNEAILCIFCVLFALLAYLTHLEYLPLNNDTDEGRRALVTVEMMLSGNYLTPTINGEIYLNKPPLYNWIVAGYFRLFGDYTMFAFRLPVIIACSVMFLTVYYFVKKYTNRRIAFFAAFAFLTNGRILIYDSLLGLIDATFSWVIYLIIMLIFFYGQKKNYYSLFIVTYFLVALGFLMKGLPSLVFQMVTLLVYFIMTRDFKKLFHPAHFVGIAVFLLVTGVYYYGLLSNNPVTAQMVFAKLLQESIQRTGLKFGIWPTIMHIITFPFEFIYHFAPWTIFAIALLHKNVWEYVRKNAFIHYSLLVFLANIFVYWISPQVYARYLFMFIPMFFSILFYFFFSIVRENSWQKNLIHSIIIVSTLLLWVSCLPLPFLNELKNVSSIYLKTTFLFVILGAVTFIVLKKPQYRMHAFAFAVVIMRLAFNWLILEQRGKRYFEAKALSDKIVSITKSHDLYLLSNANVGNFDGMSFYISTQRQEVLRYNDKIEKNAFYIADFKQLDTLKNYTEYLRFNNHLSDSLKLVKF